MTGQSHYSGAMQADLAAIEAAIATVQRILDALTSRGHEQEAFEVARAQFSASIRDSWPGNAAKLVKTLDEVREAPNLDLSEEERADLAHAISVFRQAIG